MIGFGIVICACGSDSVVECHLAKVKVAGPNPVSRSNGSIDCVSEKESLKIEQSIDGIRLHTVKCDAIAAPQGFAPKVVAKATTPSPAPRVSETERLAIIVQHI